MLARAFAIDGLSKTSELETLYRLAGEMPTGGRVVEVGDVTVEHSVWYTRERPSLQPLVAGRIAARRLLRR